MTQTIEHESLKDLTVRGRNLTRQLGRATRPAEILLLARQIEAICFQLHESASAQKQATTHIEVLDSIEELPVEEDSEQFQALQSEMASLQDQVSRIEATVSGLDGIKRDIDIIASVIVGEQPLEHGDVRQKLSEYLDSALSVGYAARVRYHLDHCATCLAFVRTLERTIDELHGLPPFELEVTSKNSLLERADREERTVDREERAAFEALVNEYGDHLYSVALRITGSPEEAEDATQDAFLSAYRALDTFAGSAQIETWLFRIAVNAALQRVRRHHPEDYLGATGLDRLIVVDWSDEVQRWVEQHELRSVLERGIGRLPEDLRVALILRDVEQFSTSEAAQILELTEPALRSRLHGARLLLRQYLAEYLGESTAPNDLSNLSRQLT
jgi:RNA polymerase sigma-70 factor (ECF subfamily)